MCLMHLKYKFEIMELGDQIVAIPIEKDICDFRGVIKMNETSAFIFRLLEKEVTEQEIVESLEREYDAPQNVLVDEVKKNIAELNEKGLLIQ